MHKPEYHIFVCNSFRVSGDPQGICNKQGAPSLMAVLEEEIADRGINAQVTATGCLKACDRGPVMIIQPQNWWYGRVDAAAIEQIIDALEDGESVPQLLIC